MLGVLATGCTLSMLDALGAGCTMLGALATGYP